MNIQLLAEYKQQTVTAIEASIVQGQADLATAQAELDRLNTLATQETFTLDDINFLNAQQ